MGKTSLVLNIAQHVAVQPEMTVGFFSLEMSKESLFIRLLTSEAQIDSHRLMSGHIGERDYSRISQALERLSGRKMARELAAELNQAIHELEGQYIDNGSRRSTEYDGG